MKIRIASNNQWRNDDNVKNWAAIGEDCSAAGRVPGLLRAYSEIAPDVLGLQEVSPLMTELMAPSMKALPLPDGNTAAYEFISGGDTPIWFRADKLKLCESGFFRFPKEIEGLEGSFNNASTKSYTYGVFEERTTKEKILVASVHLWWKSGDPAVSWYQPYSDEAREWQLNLLMEKVEKIADAYGIPAVILGDFNCVMDSRCMKNAVARGWNDVFYLCGNAEDTRGHHYCYASGFRHDDDPGHFAEAIDHIIVYEKNAPKVTAFRRHMPLYFDKLSDHFPLYIDVE